MNAYELADTLETLTTNPNNGEITFHIKPVKEIIATLRQQADRIAELEIYEDQIKKIKNRKDLLNFILEKASD